MQYNCTQCGRFLHTSSKESELTEVLGPGLFSAFRQKPKTDVQLHCSSATCPIRNIVIEDMRGAARKAYEEAERERDSSLRILRLSFAAVIIGVIMMDTKAAVIGVFIIIASIFGAALPNFISYLGARHIMKLNADAAPVTDIGRSRVRSRIIEMEIDSNTGDMVGRIWCGSRTGQDLGQMTKAQCLRLFQECELSDPEGARLLQAYIAQRYA